LKHSLNLCTTLKELELNIDYVNQLESKTIWLYNSFLKNQILALTGLKNLKIQNHELKNFLMLIFFRANIPLSWIISVSDDLGTLVSSEKNIRNFENLKKTNTIFFKTIDYCTNKRIKKLLNIYFNYNVNIYPNIYTF
jgi:hypothetical protein